MARDEIAYACYFCRTPSPTETAQCPDCGAHIDPGAIAELHRIDALVERIQDWERQGRMDREAAQTLLGHHRARKAGLTQGLRSRPPRPAHTELERLVVLLRLIAHRKSITQDNKVWADPFSGTPPPAEPLDATARADSLRPDRPRRAGRPWNRLRTLSDHALRFLTQRYTAILYGLGALLLLLSAPVIVTEQWRSLPGTVRFIVLYSGTMAAFLASQWLMKSKRRRKSGYGLLYAVTLLVPLNGILASHGNIYRSPSRILSAAIVAGITYSFYQLAWSAGRVVYRRWAASYARVMAALTLAAMVGKPAVGWLGGDSGAFPYLLGLLTAWAFSRLTVANWGLWGPRAAAALVLYAGSLGGACAAVSIYLYALAPGQGFHAYGPLIVLLSILLLYIQRYTMEAGGPSLKRWIRPVRVLIGIGCTLALWNPWSLLGATGLTAALLITAAGRSGSTLYLQAGYGAALLAYYQLMWVRSGAWVAWLSDGLENALGPGLGAWSLQAAWLLPPLAGLLLALAHMSRSHPGLGRVTGAWGVWMALLVMILSLHDGRLVLALLPGFGLGCLLAARAYRSSHPLYALFAFIILTLYYCCATAGVPLPVRAFYVGLLGIVYWALGGLCEVVWQTLGRAPMAHQDQRLLRGIVQSLYDMALLLSLLSLGGAVHALIRPPIGLYSVWALLVSACLFVAVSLSYESLPFFYTGFACFCALAGFLLHGSGADVSLYALAAGVLSLGMILFAYATLYGWYVAITPRQLLGRFDLRPANAERRVWRRASAHAGACLVVMALLGACLAGSRPATPLTLAVAAIAGYFLSRVLYSPRYLYVPLLALTMLAHDLTTRHSRQDPVLYLVWVPAILINLWLGLAHLLYRLRVRLSAWEGSYSGSLAQVVYDYATLYLTLPFLAAAFVLRLHPHAYTALLGTLIHLLWTRKDGATRYLKIPAMALVLASCCRLAFASEGLITILLAAAAFAFLAAILRSPAWLYPGMLVLNGGLYSLYCKSLALPYSAWVLMGGAHLWWVVGYWSKRSGAALAARVGFNGNQRYLPFFNTAYAVAAFVLARTLLPLLSRFAPDFVLGPMAALLPFAAFFLLQVKTHSDRTWLYGFLMIATAPLLIGASFRFPTHPTSFIYLLGLVNIWLLAYNLIAKHRAGFCRRLGIEPDRYELPFYHAAVAVLLIMLLEFFYNTAAQATDPVELRMAILGQVAFATALLVLTFLHLVLLNPTEFFVNCLLFTIITGVFWQTQLIYFKAMGPGFYYPVLEFATLALLFLVAFGLVRKDAVFRLYGLRGRLRYTPSEKAALERMIYHWIIVLAMSAFVLSAISSAERQARPPTVKNDVGQIVKKNIRQFLRTPLDNGTDAIRQEPETLSKDQEIRPRLLTMIALWITTLVLCALSFLRPTRFCLMSAWIGALYSGYALLLYMSMRLAPGTFRVSLLTYFGLWTASLSYVAIWLPRLPGMALFRPFPVLGRISDAFRHVGLIECMIPVFAATPLDPTNHGALIIAGVLMVQQALIRAYETQQASKVYFAGGILISLLLYLYLKLEWFHFGMDNLAVAVLGLSLLGLIAAEALRHPRSKVYVGPLHAMAATLPLLSLALAYQEGGSMGIGIGLAATAFYLLLYDKDRWAPFLYLAALLFNVNVYLLGVRLGISDPPAYLLTSGLTILGLVNLRKEPLSRVRRHRIRCLALLLMYTALLWSVMGSEGPLFNWLLALSCLGGILAGHGLRIRAYFFMGLLFLALDILVQIAELWRQDSVYTMALIGLGLIAAAALLGRRHEAIATRWRAVLSEWE